MCTIKETQLEVTLDFFHNIIPWYGKTYTSHLLLIKNLFTVPLTCISYLIKMSLIR